MTKPVLYIDFSPQSVKPERWAALEHPAARFEIIAGNRDALEPVIARVEICLGWLPSEMLAKMIGLKWYQNMGAGMEWLAGLDCYWEADPIFTGASGVHPIQITEHIFAFILAWNRRLHHAMRQQFEGTYPRRRGDRPDDLEGKTILIFGIGAIGERTATIAKAFGMHTIGVRRNHTQSVDGVDRMVSPNGLRAVLPEADFVVNTAPYSPQTHHAFAAAEFKAMKPNAFYINIGRGRTTDEPALVEALLSGSIAGAGLDVFEEEPLPESSPLYRLSNVILTGHYSGQSIHYNDRLLDLFIENLNRYLRNDPMLNRFTRDDFSER